MQDEIFCNMPFIAIGVFDLRFRQGAIIIAGLCRAKYIIYVCRF